MWIVGILEDGPVSIINANRVEIIHVEPDEPYTLWLSGSDREMYIDIRGKSESFADAMNFAESLLAKESK